MPSSSDPPKKSPPEPPKPGQESLKAPKPGSPGYKGSSGSWYFNTFPIETFPKNLGKETGPGSGGAKFGWHGSAQYDTSAMEVEQIRKRAEIRRALKQEFNRQYYDPYRFINQVEMLDPSIQRFMAMRASMYDYWKPTWKSFYTYYSMILIPILGTGHYDYKKKLKLDNQVRSGQLKYEDRLYKCPA